MLVDFALIISILMALYLFSYAYIEGIRISESDQKVDGGITFIFSIMMAFVFSGFTYLFI
ncbi:hypothetical protein JOC86_002838 [Bacillus pakistanensis]|uniref:Uncharacterized protein n=1 Tax=Rossellomorea pakistanensis TaxID=992288 RepID=A0ABS2NEL6_9BACI|nr:hypothetical protein [Bacillus pakistanensis]MBM7586296.1 hypothetical protein [Bacillus pakistanensis]